MLLSIPATVTLSSGATYPFSNLYPRSRVTKLLAQFGGQFVQSGLFDCFLLFYKVPFPSGQRESRKRGADGVVSVMFHHIGEMLILLWRALAALPLTWRQRRKVLEQLFEIGYASLFMVCVLSLFIGAVIALQTGPLLVESGLTGAVGAVVGISICRELAPVMMSILIAGRIGSAMAAEIGSMQVYQEIDALRTMNINPIHYLVLPRMVAIALAVPLLVIFSILTGWLGGAMVCSANHRIDISFLTFFGNLSDSVKISDVMNGVFKSFIFAVVIGVVSCQQGLDTRGGPRGIGRTVTKAVVNSIVMIVFCDYILTRILLR